MSEDDTGKPPQETPKPDLDALAWQAGHGATDEELNAAMSQLMPVIERMAAWVARKYKEAVRMELVEEGVPHVLLQIDQYDPEKGRFLTWCAAALKHKLIDIRRRRQREREGLKRYAQAQDTPVVEVCHDPETGDLLFETKEQGKGALKQAKREQERIDAEIDASLPLSPADLARIQRWPVTVRTRVILLCQAGLWPRVPEAQWNEWVEDGRLDPPFPPYGILKLDNVVDRNRFLAEVLGEPVNNLTQLWSRHKALLAGLGCIRGLRDE